MDFIKEKTCCFTGHRPEKLNIDPSKVKQILKNAITEEIGKGYTTFISGMARGIDMWAAEFVIEEKRQNKDIKLVCALPHPNFEKKWSKDNQLLYNHILNNADYVHTVCPEYFMGAYMQRNKWMVDRSSLVLAFYNGSRGGTFNTISYARRNSISITIL